MSMTLKNLRGKVGRLMETQIHEWRQKGYTPTDSQVKVVAEQMVDPISPQDMASLAKLLNEDPGLLASNELTNILRNNVRKLLIQYARETYNDSVAEWEEARREYESGRLASRKKKSASAAD